MTKFIVTTWEEVEGCYEVEASNEAEARAKFKPKRGHLRLIDFDGVEQLSYHAFDVNVESVGEPEN